MGGADTMGTHIRRTLPDAHRASLGVVLGTSGGKGDKRGRYNIIHRGVGETGKRRGGGGEREPTKWDRVVEMLHTAFRDGVLVEEATWQAVVLILKGGVDYRGKGLVKVICNAVAVILKI